MNKSYEAKETKRLYKVESIAGKLTHDGHVYSNVSIIWFVQRSVPPAPRHKDILDYEIPHEEVLWEPFTQTQARVFAAYLLAVHGDAAAIKEIERNEDLIPVGSVSDVYMIHKEPEYMLNFNVSGYYWVEPQKGVPF